MDTVSLLSFAYSGRLHYAATPTVAGSAAARRRKRAEPAHLSWTASSPDEALRLEELARTRVFSILTVILCVLVLAALPLLGGSPVARGAVAAVTASGILVSLGVIATVRDPGRFTPRLVAVVTVWSVLSTYVGILFWGIFSPAPVLPVIGLYFFGRSQSRRNALAAYLMTAAIQGGASALILSGLVKDPGLLTLGDAPIFLRGFTQVLLQFVFFAAYVMARWSRTSTVRAMDALLSVKRRLSQREALLREVGADLDRALDRGGPGRHTDQVFGSYRLGPVVGRGGMAEVYAALHVETGGRAAVKILHAHLLSNPSAIVRFMREAQAASALESPHTVRVLDSAPDAEVPYLVMEYLEGHDLAYHLRQRTELPLDELAELLAQVGSVIDAAQETGIVHRDLKPQNLFFAEGEKGAAWKILDFGISKLGGSMGTLTEGRVIGTPSYMSPEQARGGAVDGATDRYALAAIAYRCLTGRPPFTGDDMPGTLHEVVYGMPMQPSLLAEVPDAVDDILAIGLAKRPEDRFATAAELATALGEVARGRRDPALKQRASVLLQQHPWGLTHRQHRP